MFDSVLAVVQPSPSSLKEVKSAQKETSFIPSRLNGFSFDP